MNNHSFIIHSMFSVLVHDPRTTSVASPISTYKDERNFAIADDKGDSTTTEGVTINYMILQLFNVYEGF